MTDGVAVKRQVLGARFGDATIESPNRSPVMDTMSKN